LFLPHRVNLKTSIGPLVQFLGRQSINETDFGMDMVEMLGGILVSEGKPDLVRASSFAQLFAGLYSVQPSYTISEKQL
jgi:hypothetical protein